MSYLLSQLEGAERHAECIRQDAALVQAIYPALEGGATGFDRSRRPTCGKLRGMCAMVPDASGKPASGMCPECGVDCGTDGVEAPKLRAYLVTIGSRPSFEVMATSSFAAWEQHVGMASGDERVEVRKVVRHG